MGRLTGNDRPRGSKGRKLHRDVVAADYVAVDWVRAGRAIAGISNHGGAVRLGYTRDGGAYAVGVYGDGDTPYTEYIKPDESLETFLEEVAELFNDSADERAQPKAGLKQGTLPGTADH